MRFKSATLLAALALLTLAPSHAQARQQEQKDEQKDQKVIDDFIATRGVSFDAPPKATTGAKPVTPPRHKYATGQKNPSSTAANKNPSKNNAKQNPAANNNVDAAGNDGPAASPSGGGTDGAKLLNASAQNLSFGYTIYMKDAAGTLLPAPLSKTYRAGDRIVFVLETGTDGYLYVFDAENDKNPSMIYPDVQVNNGENEVRAHVRETYPAVPDLAFQFDANPVTEHIYIVVSREPLAGVPTGEALEKFCAKSRGDCAWRPTAAQWAPIHAAALDRGIVEAKNVLLAQGGGEPVMPVALQRGIRIKREEPAPSIVRVSNSPAAKMLVTKIELAHN